MVQLAIQGHPTRGKEVIEILEMLGGKNIKYYIGTSTNYFYFIDNGNAIIGLYYTIPTNYTIFTLEEFLEKYPFKVGDKVKIYVQNDDIDGICDIEVAEITSMRWDSSRCKIAYKMKDINREFYKEEIKCKVDDNSNHTEITKISYLSINDEDYDDQIEINLGDNYEYKFEMNRLYIVKKKPKYPKTFIEVLNFRHPDRQLEDDYQRDYKKDLIEKFQDLLYARDVYWKIAGEEMGLGKPWNPDFTNNDEERYGIYTVANKVEKDFCGVGDVNTVLTFPTEEMRNAFYENFKDLIEKCKELL